MWIEEHCSFNLSREDYKDKEDTFKNLPVFKITFFEFEDNSISYNVWFPTKFPLIPLFFTRIILSGVQSNYLVNNFVNPNENQVLCDRWILFELHYSSDSCDELWSEISEREKGLWMIKHTSVQRQDNKSATDNRMY